MSSYLKDRIRGSLVGGAIGDALGYPVEFIYSYEGIQSRYGERGITRLDTKQYSLGKGEQGNKAVVSDDTQMTLFTANGLLNAPKLGIEPKYSICRAYLEWLEKPDQPNGTCMILISGGSYMNCCDVKLIEEWHKELYAAYNDRMSILDADRLAGDAAEITHQHPLGFISAALMVHLIYRLAQDEHPTRSALKNYITEGVEAMRELYGSHYNDVERMAELAERAVFLSSNADSDLENIKRLGEGWVGEETLAIGLYCALKYFDNFEEAMIASVNHGGDSDSTGAVTGNILGAAIGYDAIPQFYKEDVELLDVILHMADDLCLGEVTKYHK